MIQYPRAFSCVIGTLDGSNALEFSQFRVQFTVSRGDISTPNTCDVRIFNLADGTAQQVQNEFDQIVLKAGYQPLGANAGPGNIALIFKGTLKQVRKGRLDQKDTYIDVTGADGDEAYNFSVMSLSLAAGAAAPDKSVQHILQTMAGLGVTQAPLPTLGTNGSIRGRVFYGMSRDEMNEWAAQNNCVWSIQDGEVTVIPKAFPIPSTPVLVSPQTGLIGTPEQIQNGISVRTLLNPALKVGTQIRLQSVVNRYKFSVDIKQAPNVNIAQQNKVNPDGLYYIMNVSHSGDTRGTPWYSDLICLSIDATVTDAGAFSAVGPDNIGPIKPY